jgi:DnaJ-class molecular chaperone
MNYYELLGVEKNATPEQLKKAYKKAAMDNHPDRGGSEDKFKQINEAYDTLKDPNKRAHYDHVSSGGHPHNNQHHQGGGHPFDGFNFQFNGHPFDFDFMFNSHPFNKRPMSNKDIHVNYTISLEEAFTGKDTTLNVNVGNITKTINLTIPAGVETGAQIRFAGEGLQENKDLPPGNMVVIVHIANDEKFERYNSDIRSTVSVGAFEAMAGGDVLFENIDGTTIKVKIPEGTQHGDTLRVSGKGMPHWRKPEHRGDLYLTINIKVPKMSELDETVYQALKKANLLKD